MRKISKSKWYKLAWMSAADVQGDCLKDLKTDSNVLSVWYIDENMSNLDHVLTCLASNNDSISHVDYALIDISVVLALGIKVADDVPGKTPFVPGNIWHRDLVELTGAKILDLAREIQDRAHLRLRGERGYIQKLLSTALQEQTLDMSLIKPGLHQEIASGHRS